MYLFNILTVLYKWIIRWFWVNVTTKASGHLMPKNKKIKKIKLIEQINQNMIKQFHGIICRDKRKIMF